MSILHLVKRTRLAGGTARLRVCAAVAVATALAVTAAAAQGRRDDAYRPQAESPTAWQGSPTADQGYGGQGYGGQGGPAYPQAPPTSGYGQYPQPQPAPGYGAPPPAAGYGQNTYGQPQTYGAAPPPAYGSPGYAAPPPQGYANNSGGYGNAGPAADDAYRSPRQDGYGAPYSPPPAYDQGPPPRYDGRADERPTNGYYSQGEIVEKGRGFFGSITQGLASAIEYTYQNVGRPNGYLLGEDGGGAFFAGLRYGEGMLYTKDAGDHKVYWQGPSLGYDIGGEGSKIMILVYNMRAPSDIYHRYGGVEGSTYVVGGVSVQLQKRDDVTLAIIRSGVGLRLGVNVGYLKYSREPTWNPF